MKTVRIIVMLFAAMFLPFIADSDDRTIRRNKPSATSEKRTALVIGNSNYASSPLKNPVNDARDMAKTLEELGFDVIHRTNADKKTMKDAIRDFEKKLRGGGVGLFYFAGHGMQVNGKNYLIPTDAQIETEADAEDASVEANWILGKMEDAGNDINIVILDACRNNPVARSFRSAKSGLAEMKAPKGAVIAYATSPGDVAADGNGKNGTYTRYLLKYLREPGLEIGQFFKKVGKDVAAETGEKQMPWMHSKFYGDFYFLADSGEKPKPPEPEKPVASQEVHSKHETYMNFETNGREWGPLEPPHRDGIRRCDTDKPSSCTYEEILSGKICCASGLKFASFNNYTDDKNWGDARKFLKVSSDKSPKDSDKLKVKPDDVLMFIALINNEGTEGLYPAFDVKAKMSGFKMAEDRRFIVSDYGTSLKFTMMITSSNTKPAYIFDSVEIYSDTKIRLKYYTGNLGYSKLGGTEIIYYNQEISFFTGANGGMIIGDSSNPVSGTFNSRSDLYIYIVFKLIVEK